MLRCIKTGIAQVHCKLKTELEPPRGGKLSKRQERQLLNERVRSINHTLSLCGFKRDICYNRLKDLLDRETLQESWSFTNRVRDYQHNKVKYRQIAKFNRLLDKQGYMYDN